MPQSPMSEVIISYIQPRGARHRGNHCLHSRSGDAIKSHARNRQAQTLSPSPSPSRKPLLTRAPAFPPPVPPAQVLSSWRSPARLIDAALRLVEEGGPEAVSVREAARRAGVSPARAVPALRKPRRADDGGGREAAAFQGPDRCRACGGSRRRPAGAARASGWPICAGRCVTRRISRPSSGRHFDQRQGGHGRGTMPTDRATERMLAEAYAQGHSGLRPEAGADRRPRAFTALRG